MRLNDWDVVELINRYQKVIFTGSDLLHSLPGQEYATPKQLYGENLKTVKQAAGRIPVVSISLSSTVALLLLAIQAAPAPSP